METTREFTPLNFDNLVDIMHMPISYGTIYEHTLVMVTISTIVQFPPNLLTCDIAKDFLLGKK
jgi:hypothetical protein